MGILESILFLFVGVRSGLILAAVIPAVILLVRIYRADRLERESGRLLLQLVGLGVLSTFGAYIWEFVGDRIMEGLWMRGVIRSASLYYLLYYFLVVALAEESCKYLLMKRRTWNSPEFNCQFDGIVYATFVSLGFALAENISYVSEYGFGTALIRAVTAIPGHTCFGIFMGLWYGLARKAAYRGNTVPARRLRRLALAVPVMLHGTYDYIATRDKSGFTLIFIIFIALMFGLSYYMVKRMSRSDSYIF